MQRLDIAFFFCIRYERQASTAISCNKQFFPGIHMIISYNRIFPAKARKFRAQNEAFFCVPFASMFVLRTISIFNIRDGEEKINSETIPDATKLAIHSNFYWMQCKRYAVCLKWMRIIVDGWCERILWLFCILTGSPWQLMAVDTKKEYARGWSLLC